MPVKISIKFRASRAFFSFSVSRLSPDPAFVSSRSTFTSRFSEARPPNILDCRTFPGSESNLAWSRNAEGVTVGLPERPPCEYAYVLKINPAA